MAIVDDDQKRRQIVEMLTRAYWMEIETVMNYVSNSINPDGVRAEHVKKNLEADVAEELGHAQQFGKRINELYGEVPGSTQFKAEQSYLQPPRQSTDIVSIIKGVIEAERGAIDFYNQIIRFCDGVDYITQDLVITISADEQKHLRTFEGFLKEYESR